MCCPCSESVKIANERRLQDEAAAQEAGTRLSSTPYRTADGGAVIAGVYYEPDES